MRDVLKEFGELIDTQPVGGGCISDAQQVHMLAADGSSQTLFVKSNDASFLDNFQCEAAGLKQLHDARAIRVPRVLKVARSGRKSFLVTEWIDEGRRGADFFPKFGEHLAQLHAISVGLRYGWEHDNYLGAARQVNSYCDDWPAFVAEHRIGFQIRWAVDEGAASANLQRDCQQIVRDIDQILAGRADRASLLHGDLWSGNYLCDSDGQSVIIDPAVYHGCHEAEFGMLRLFGSCPPAFYDAYEAVLPMKAGWQRRVNVYVLYHLLNHLNLFGSGYLGQCQSLAAEILRA